MIWLATIKDHVTRGQWLEDDYHWITTYYVEVYTSNGNVFAHKHGFRTKEGADRLLDRVVCAITHPSSGWSPEDNEHWVAQQPQYGSEAYQASGGDRVHHADLEPELNPYRSEGQRHRVALERDFYGSMS